MLYTLSPNHDMQRLPSCSSKNATPSCFASSGMYSMMACRTRHCLSSANSTIAGRRDCERSSIPITEEVRISALHHNGVSNIFTIIHSFELANDVQSNVWEVVLEKL